MSVIETKDFVGDFLEHFGVKGMRWGRRKDSGGGGGSHSNDRFSSKDDDSEDFTRTSAVAVKAKGSGLRSLSNKELRDLVDRINLEQNFSKVTTPQAKESNAIKTGVNYFSGKLLKVGDMTVDTILKTAVQVNVEQHKGKMRIAPPGSKS